MAEVRPAIEAAEQATQRGLFAVGYISYEAGWAFNDAEVVPPRSEMPLVWFALFSESVPFVPTFPHNDFNLSQFEPSIDRQKYELCLQKIKEAIATGDTYQVNYTMKMAADFYGNDLALYQDLTASLKSKYCAYLNLGRYRIISLSPELFFSRNQAQIITRPMKGTVKRGRWPGEDEKFRNWLSHSDKNQAENTMIVDLVRNDLGRLAKTGTVSVTNLFQIEKYPNVYQMTSTIKAEIPNVISTTKILEALFPCGSITGAPKLSTMSLINQLEPTARGVYCGSIGIISPKQSSIFNVAIRTLVIDTKTGKVEFGTGGGITWDSLPDEEYNEALDKAGILRNRPIDFQLIETLLLQEGSYFLLDRHLHRLLRSARYFDIPMNPGQIRQTLLEFSGTICWPKARVRLLLDAHGQCTIQSNELEPKNDSAAEVVLADSPVNKADRCLYHKTTNREIYDKHRRTHPSFFDVLLWNEDREMTEFTTGNLVVNIDGELLTPPLESGLLPGTFREELLKRKDISEKTIYKEDLIKASGIWFINSVRKWVEVKLSLTYNDCA